MNLRGMLQAIVFGGILFFVLFWTVSNVIGETVEIETSNLLAYATYFVSPLAASAIARTRRFLVALFTGAACVLIALTVFRIATYPSIILQGVLVTVGMGLALSVLAGCVSITVAQLLSKKPAEQGEALKP